MSELVARLRAEASPGAVPVASATDPTRRAAPVRHRADPPWRVWVDGQPLRRPVAAAVLLLVGAGAAVTAAGGDTDRGTAGFADGRPAGVTALTRLSDREGDRASRSTTRAPMSASPQGAASPTPGATGSSPAAAGSSGSKSPTPPPASPQPVGGLTRLQMAYAATIVRVGEQMKLPTRAYVVAIATALQESRLTNLANWYVAESLNLAHDGVGGDHDSVGLFQQRPSSGWGTVAELMDPATSARRFYQALEQVSGWQSMSITVAAQTVQVSAFPDAYAQQVPLATEVVDALT